MTVPAFVGRQGEIASLDLLLAEDGEAAPVVICAVSGTAGVGKTALAVHWAHRMRAWFPDGQLYLNLRGFEASAPPVQPGEAIRVFLDALAVPAHRIPVGLAEQVGLYRSLVADRRILVVLDNARDSEQVRPLLPGGEAARVVITSRNRLLGLVAAEGARPLPLGTMDEGEANELLRHRLGSGRVDREPAAAAEIVARCGGLPLALALVAARVAADPRFTLQELALELQDSVTPLDSMTTGQDQATDLRHVFSRSYATLSAQGQAMFRMLGLHPGPQTAEATAASMANRSLEETRRILAELYDAGLATEIAPGIYTLHDLLHAYARELSEREDARRTGTRPSTASSTTISSAQSTPTGSWSRTGIGSTCRRPARAPSPRRSRAVPRPSRGSPRSIPRCFEPSSWPPPADSTNTHGACHGRWSPTSTSRAVGSRSRPPRTSRWPRRNGSGTWKPRAVPYGIWPTPASRWATSTRRTSTCSAPSRSSRGSATRRHRQTPT